MTEPERSRAADVRPQRSVSVGEANARAPSSPPSRGAALLDLQGPGENRAVVRVLRGAGVGSWPQQDAESGDIGMVVARLGTAGNGAVCRLLDESRTQGADEAPKDFARSVAASDAGRSLPDGFRAKAETMFGADFSAVRVHDDSDAAAAAERASALAFTVGSDTYFAKGWYDPESAGGQRLLAHELTHVVQQPSVPVQPNGVRSAPFSSPGDPAEQAAEAAAEQFAKGGLVRVLGRSTATVARQDDGGVATAPAGDVRDMSISAQYAVNLPADRLSEQLRTLDGHIATLTPGSPEYVAARENEDILQKEQVNRLVQGSGRSTAGDTVATMHARFQQAVLLSAQHRLKQNQENLDEWRALIETQFSAATLQTQVLAQAAADLQGAAQRTGGMPAYNAWSNDPNPYRRNVEEHQSRDQWRACTGCHEIVRADELSRHEAHTGPAWTSPAERLSRAAGLPSGSPDPWAAVDGSASARVQAAINAIRPVVGPLGDQGYRIIPDDVFSLRSSQTPEELRATILEKIAQRRTDYGELSARIADGQINYLQLGPVLRNLLPTADPEVQQAVADDQTAEHVWAIVQIGVTLVLTLLSIVFPPAGLALAAVQLAAGAQSIQTGYAYQLGAGANDVFTREQQDAAGGMMASGFVDVTTALIAIGSALASATGGRSLAVTNEPVVEPDVVYTAPQVDAQTGVVSQMAFHRPSGQYLRATLNPATGTGEIVNLSTGQPVASVANGTVSPPARGLLGAGDSPAVAGGPAVRMSTGVMQPTGTRVVDPFSGETLGTQSASAQTQRSLITAIRADEGETAAWRIALSRGEIGLQAPAGANVSGPDFLTAEVSGNGQVTLVITDVKTSTVGSFPRPATLVPATWMSELQSAIAPGRLNLGDPVLEAAIRQAFAAGRVRFRQVDADYSPAGGGSITGF